MSCAETDRADAANAPGGRVRDIDFSPRDAHTADTGRVAHRP
jgi:hypothetical protein